MARWSAACAAAAVVLAAALAAAAAQEPEGVGAAEKLREHIHASRGNLDDAHSTAQQLRDTGSLEEDPGLEKQLHEQLDASLRHQGAAHEHLSVLADQLSRDADLAYLRRWQELQRRSAARMNTGALRVHSVMAVVWRADHEGVASRQRLVRAGLERLRELKLALVASLSRATRDANLAEALAARDQGHTKLHARLDAHLHTTVAARQALNSVVEARLAVLEARALLSDAQERERLADQLLPLEGCEADMARAYESSASYGAALRPSAMQLTCMDTMRAAFQAAREELAEVPAAERESGVRGICKGVRAIFSSQLLANRTSRACRRMRDVGGEVVDLGLYRIGLRNYKCSKGETACSGHGICTDASACHCANGWIGKDCSMKRCENGCRNGFCDRGVCRCRAGFAGKTCSLEDCPFHEDKRCAGVGMCLRVRSRTDGTQKLQCQCPQGYSGDACERRTCPFGTVYPFECSDRGECGADGVCKCFHGFNGTACENRAVKHGVCNAKGACVCDAGWSGSACDLQRCPADCSGHGVCDGRSGACECERGWRGLDCAEAAPRCPLNATQLAEGLEADAVPLEQHCSGRGLCRPPAGVQVAGEGVCVCPPGWRGAACGKRDCPFNCSGRGVCKASGVCICHTGFRGDGCEVTAPVNSVCAAECGRDCLREPATSCSVSRTGGEFNVNKGVYAGEVVDGSAEVKAAADAGKDAEAAAAALKRETRAEPPKSTECYLACSRKCVMERCWKRGLELARSEA